MKGKFRNYNEFIRLKLNSLKWSLKNSKVKLVHKVIQKKAPQNVTIIAQDCIGGALYQFMGKEYLSPTVGLWISTPEYMKFIEIADRLSEFDLVFEKSTEFDYPIGYINGIKIGFQHFKNEQEAREKWVRRCAKIKVDDIYYIADFRYPWYKKEDIELWNNFKLPQSLAIVDRFVEKEFGIIHNSLILTSKQDYNNTRKEIVRKFVIWTWLNNRKLKRPNIMESIQLNFLSFLYYK